MKKNSRATHSRYSVQKHGAKLLRSSGSWVRFPSPIIYIYCCMSFLIAHNMQV